MTGLTSHKELLVWQKSLTLASKVYNATSELPDSERYGLSSQIRRSVVSVASNIAEGAARGRRTEFIHFLRIARGSLTELETQVLIAANLSMISPKQRLEDDIAEIGRMLTALIRRLSEPRSMDSRRSG